MRRIRRHLGHRWHIGSKFALVRETGFIYACSNVPGVTQSTDRSQLPRIHAHDRDGETFCEHLLEWFVG
jgi:hypothetical protein